MELIKSYNWDHRQYLVRPSPSVYYVLLVYSLMTVTSVHSVLDVDLTTVALVLQRFLKRFCVVLVDWSPISTLSFTSQASNLTLKFRSIRPITMVTLQSNLPTLKSTSIQLQITPVTCRFTFRSDPSTLTSWTRVLSVVSTSITYP